MCRLTVYLNNHDKTSFPPDICTYMVGVPYRESTPAAVQQPPENTLMEQPPDNGKSQGFHKLFRCGLNKKKCLWSRLNP